MTVLNELPFQGEEHLNNPFHKIVKHGLKFLKVINLFASDASDALLLTNLYLQKQIHSHFAVKGKVKAQKKK